MMKYDARVDANNVAIEWTHFENLHCLKLQPSDYISKEIQLIKDALKPSFSGLDQCKIHKYNIP